LGARRNVQVTLKIDGKEVSVEKGTLLIEAAKKAGIDIPHFCYHPKLNPDANCRMCLVEVEKIPKLQTACSTPVNDGMVVYSSKENVKEARDGVMEFILSNHPLDCPICDEGGDCQLQDIAHEYSARGRFEEDKRAFDKGFHAALIGLQFRGIGAAGPNHVAHKNTDPPKGHGNKDKN